MGKNKWVICLSGYYSPNYVYGIGNTINEFHKDEHKILWVNSIPNRNASANRVGGKKSLIKIIFNKFKKHLKPIKRVRKNYYVLSPFYIPFPENKYCYPLNNFLVKNQIKLLSFFLRIEKRPILVSSTMMDTLKLFRKDKIRFYIHYIADLYSDYREASETLRVSLKKKESDLFNEADLLLVSSLSVLKKVENIVENKSKIKYYPHGVEFSHFNLKNKNSSLLPFEKPIAGYFGSLTMANDKDCILALANAGFSIVLIGEIKGDFSLLRENSSIHFMGPIPYESLPHYAVNFDIAFMAWRDAEWIQNSNPKKSFEYLALGLPIVSKRIAQLEKELADFIYFADSALDFGEKAILAHKENSEIRVLKRKDKAKEHDWRQKYLSLKEIIYE